MRANSQQLVAASNSQNSGEREIYLLVMEHPDFDQTIRLVAGREQVTSNGEVFLPAPFSLILPDDKEGGSPRGKIRFDNITRELTVALMDLTASPEITMMVALASQPDAIEFQADGFVLENARWEAGAPVISADLVIHDLAQEPAQRHIANADLFPGLA